MEKQTKEIKLGIMLNYASMIIEGLIIFILNPFIIRKLGQETYGVYTLITSFSGYLSIFEFGLGTAIIRYVSKYNAEKNEEDKSKFLSICFQIYFILTFAIMIIATILYLNLDKIFINSLNTEQIILAKNLFIIIAASISITTLGTVFSSIILGYEKFIFSRSLILITTILNLIFTSIILCLNPTAINLAYITLIITVITLVANIIYVFKHLKIKIKISKWDKEFSSKIFKFSIFIFLQTLIGQIYWRLDQLIIGIELANAAIPLAIYAVAMKINDLVLAFTTVINRYQLPTITRLTVVEKKDKELLKYLGSTSKFVAILYIAIIIGFIFFGSNFIKIYAGNSYSLAYYIVLIVIIPSSLSRIHGSAADVLKAKNLHGIYTLITFISAVLNIVLTVILLPKLGIIGAAIGTSISVILGNTLAFYWCLERKANINIKELFNLTFKGFMPVIIISVISGMILNNFLNDKLLFYIIKMIMFIIIYLIAIYKFTLEEREKIKIKRIIKK